MSLLKLLKIGRSLSETRATLGRYKYAEESLIRNLSRSSGRSPLQVKLANPLSAASSSLDHLPRLSEGSNSKAASPFQAFAPSPENDSPPRGVLPESRGRLSIRDRLRIPRGGLRLSFPFKCAVKFHRPLVRIKMSLDRVTVVRNDLRDSDLEIVAPRRSASLFSTGAELPARLQKLDAKELWNRLVSRALEVKPSGI